ncbi:MAG: 3-methyl-2-oxobutanoate hydroxymethyltransferase [Proteobacteria bacterium]|nr:3-methyl-2-oxobutanoate hydroxymethyltransferase [Pseudomonadota bacterium]
MDASSSRLLAVDIRARKGTVPLVCLTAYDTPMARRIDPHCDVLLVGDSLAMVVYGLETTRGVSVDTMIAHGQAVMRGSQQACVIVDLPYGSYESAPAQAVATAKRVVAETGCQGIKLEGGAEMAETITAIVAAGVPVLGHVGLLPQKAERRGGFKIQGKGDGGEKVRRDAEAAAAPGAFAIVIEGTVEAVARQITEHVAVPTIGIGASPACDGQILVTHDMVGLFADFTPKFVKRYGDAGALIEQAVRDYAGDVRAGRFPELSHCFGVAAVGV